MLKEAITLRRAGFSVIWLAKRSKMPVHKNWTGRETMSVDDLRSSYINGYNAGVRLGEPSKIGEKYLHVLDLDIRKAEYAPTVKKTVESMLQKRISDFQVVISGSGGASRHLYFVADKPFRSKKLWHSDEKFTGPDGSEHWAAEIELFGTGKQVVLPPSIHPDTGEEYRWQDGYFFEEDLLEIDSELLTELTGEGAPVEYEDEGPLGLSEDEIEEHLDRLNLKDFCEDREGWIKVGMALHHEFDGEDVGLRIWSRFSKQSKKFDARVLKQQWRSFKGAEQPVTFASIIKAANDHQHKVEWEGMADEFVDDEDDEDDIPREREKPAAPPPAARQKSDIPEHLLTIPGALGMAVEHYNETSKVYQPQFAVQTALALGSVVLARHWMTETDNFTSLYLINLGATGRGKEFARTYLERVLEEATLGSLIGPLKYASEAGVMGQLQYSPRHVTVYDEFGRLLSSTGASSNANLRDAQTILMSLFGQLGGIARGAAYSVNGKTAQQVEAMRKTKIVRPAITMLGLSTPETFFDALSQDDVANGFINRLLVVNTRQPRTPGKTRSWKKTPRSLLEWCRSYGIPEEDGGFGDFEESAAEVAEPQIIGYTTKALDLLDRIEEEVIELQNHYEEQRLDGMFSRSREIAMRISLIVALSRDKGKIDDVSLGWAWDYVLFYTKEMLGHVQRMMGSSPLMRISEVLANAIIASGVKGLSLRDLGRKSHEFAKLDKRDSEQALHYLQNFDIVLAKFEPDKKGSRVTHRYVHQKHTK